MATEKVPGTVEQEGQPPGQYKDRVDSVPQADRTQESSLPQGADPDPFKLGPMSSGGR